MCEREYKVAGGRASLRYKVKDTKWSVNIGTAVIISFRGASGHEFGHSDVLPTHPWAYLHQDTGVFVPNLYTNQFARPTVVKRF